MTSPAEIHLPRKERDRLLREEDFLVAAEDAFAEHGYHETSMEDIARRAEYATGTIYRYFKGKEELFSELVFRRMSAHYAEVEPLWRAAPGPRERLAVLLREKTRFFERHRPFLSIYQRAVSRGQAEPPYCALPKTKEMRDRFIALVNATFDEGVAAGVFRPAAPGLYAAAFHGLSHEVIFANVGLPDGQRLPPDVLADFVLGLVERGILV